jgi:hypothetical protein
MTTLPYQSVKPAARLTWTVCGKSYEFYHYPIGTVFYAIGGVYIFCALATNGLWNAIYVGETDNFLRRLTDELASHHRWDAISRAGATHICALAVNGNASERVALETTLRHGLNPPCNRQ